MEFPTAWAVRGRPKLYLKNAILSIVKIDKKNEPKFGSLVYNSYADETEKQKHTAETEKYD